MDQPPPTTRFKRLESTHLIHIANTCFEFEISSNSSFKLKELLTKTPLAAELQFLPLLFIPPNEKVAVFGKLPESYFEKLQQIGLSATSSQLIPVEEEKPLQGKCSSWGPSLAVANWAKEHDLLYDAPLDLSLIQKVNSKAFSSSFSKLEGSSLLSNVEELEKWSCEAQGEKVIKTCFGLAGSGNFRFLFLAPPLLKKCEKEWRQKRVVIGEPWVRRFLDFSTQWKIEKEGTIKLLGVTRFETDENGVYRGTLAGKEPLLFQQEHLHFIDAHQKEAYAALKIIQEMGYFGNIGIDAFLYFDKSGRLALNPIVEINGRQTMSFVALSIQKQRYPEKVARLTFGKKPKDNQSVALLPEELFLPDGKTLSFEHNFFLSEVWDNV